MALEHPSALAPSSAFPSGFILLPSLPPALTGSRRNSYKGCKGYFWGRKLWECDDEYKPGTETLYVLSQRLNLSPGFATEDVGEWLDLVLLGVSVS